MVVAEYIKSENPTPVQHPNNPDVLKKLNFLWNWNLIDRPFPSSPSSLENILQEITNNDKMRLCTKPLRFSKESNIQTSMARTCQYWNIIGIIILIKTSRKCCAPLEITTNETTTKNPQQEPRLSARDISPFIWPWTVGRSVCPLLRILQCYTLIEWNSNGPLHHHPPSNERCCPWSYTTYRRYKWIKLFARMKEERLH